VSQSQEILYSLFHWWEGDKFSDPCWCHTGTFGSLKELAERLEQSKKHGFTKHRAKKTTVEFIQLPEEEG
jgi:hypothetical protein